MTERRDHDALPKALQPFSRVLAIHDALPDGFKPSDATPLREILPGIWPTTADLRALIAWEIENRSPETKVASGWTLVPVVATPEMEAAGKSWSGLPSQTWTDMLDAAPEPPAATAAISITPQMIRDTAAWCQSEDELRETLKMAATEIEQLQMDVAIFNGHRHELLEKIDVAQPSTEPKPGPALKMSEKEAVAYRQRQDADYGKRARMGYDPFSGDSNHGALQRHAAKHSAVTRERLLALIDRPSASRAPIEPTHGFGLGDGP